MMMIIYISIHQSCVRQQIHSNLMTPYSLLVTALSCYSAYEIWDSGLLTAIIIECFAVCRHGCQKVSYSLRDVTSRKWHPRDNLPSYKRNHRSLYRTIWYTLFIAFCEILTKLGDIKVVLLRFYNLTRSMCNLMWRACYLFFLKKKFAFR